MYKDIDLELNLLLSEEPKIEHKNREEVFKYYRQRINEEKKNGRKLNQNKKNKVAHHPF